MAEEKIQVPATRMNYWLLETRLKRARMGHRLLKTKSQALQRHNKKLEDRYQKLNQDFESLFQKAFLLLSKAQLYGADIDIFKRKCQRVPVTLETRTEQICGLVIPDIKIVRSTEPIILARGGFKLSEVRTHFDTLLDTLVNLCSVKSSFLVLKTAFEMTNRRLNALEYVLIPKLERTLQCIGRELDEQERENFYKLKRIQQMRK